MKADEPMTSSSLAELQEIPLPAPPSWRPQTDGWWIVCALLAVALAWAAWRVWRQHRANRYRREALRELAAIERACSQGPDAAALARLPALLKRCALAIAPRAEVASLSGERWLAFLDARCARAGFTGEPGRALLVLAYTGVPIDSTHLRELLRAAHIWIRGHRADV